MRIYTIHKISLLLTVCIFMLTVVTITFWLNSHVTSQKFNDNSQDAGINVGITFDEEDEDDNATILESVKSITTNNDYDDYESDEDDELNDNAVFRDGDFDEPYMNNNSLPTTEMQNWIVSAFSSKSISNKLVKVHERLKSIESTKKDVWSIIEDGIFWSKDLEKHMPKGLSEDEVKQVQLFMRTSQVLELLPPSWEHCGRPQNAFVIFSNGSRACARYRVPHNYLVDGEILSFYLSRLLNISNVPVPILSRIDPRHHQWNQSSEIERSISQAAWNVNSTVVLIQWIANLERCLLPKVILKALKENFSVSSHYDDLKSFSLSDLLELMQWSDLIIFDYITGNYDRVASAQDTADKENRIGAFNESVHNLVRSRQTGALWFIDNESGLLDSYSLLYSKDHPREGQRFLTFHKQMLESLCVFRRSTFQQVAFLSRQSQPENFLLQYVNQFEPLFNEVALEATKYKLFSKYFKLRINDVYTWITHCRHAI